VRCVLALALVIAVASAARADDTTSPTTTLVHAELDPLTFATGGYGGQFGVRAPDLHGVRVALASFSIRVPDAIAQFHGNDGFHERVLPCGAVYALYYTAAPGQNGFALGGSVRFLRVRYTRDDTPGAATDIEEVSPEAIVGYQWHPLHNGFYLQPWLALGVRAYRSADPTVGARTYQELPVSPFFTVNIGYELAR